VSIASTASIDAIRDLDRRSQADAAARQETGRLDAAITDADSALERSGEQRQRCAKTLSALLLEAGVPSEAEVADLELQHQAVLEELDAAVRRRRRVSLAATLVGETLREFERTRQPAVLANASEPFQRVTGGRYSRVIQTEDAEGIVALDQFGARRTVAELSRGTQEQLYLSMRLGLAREVGARAVPLPLVMDDVLVNFDESRARHMAGELMAFAADHQVLLFTCHSFVRSMLLDLDPDVRVIDMPVYDVAGQDSRLAESETDTGTERPSSLAGPALEASVLQALVSSGPLSLTELAGRLECDPEQVRRLLSGLQDSGQVNMSGQKRGARYALGAVERA
jgi:hypothetical protein